MTTPTPTVFSPHPPLAPILVPIATYCDSFMPVLSLPHSLASTRNLLLPEISPKPYSSTTNHRRSLVNPIFTVAEAKQNFSMAIAFHPEQPTAQLCPILIRNSSRHSASPHLYPVPCALRWPSCRTSPSIACCKY